MVEFGEATTAMPAKTATTGVNQRAFTPYASRASARLEFDEVNDKVP